MPDQLRRGLREGLANPETVVSTQRGLEVNTFQLDAGRGGSRDLDRSLP